jgi:hypothetical protein
MESKEKTNISISSIILKTAVAAGLAAGACDIPMAALINDVPIPIVLKAIASGLMGSSAYSPGSNVVVIGLGLQIAMSLFIAAIYASAAVRSSSLRNHPYLAGCVFGVGIFLVMNMIVAPLSNVTPRPQVTGAWLGLNLGAMLLFGIIVARITSWQLTGRLR